MKENRPFFCFIILVLTILVLPALVRAQGDDFCCGSGGFVGGNPSWGQFPPVPGGNSNAHTGFTGPTQHIDDVRRGDTVTIRLKMDFYGLVPLILSPASGTLNSRFAQTHTEQNMRWIGPYDRRGTYDRGQLGYWCLDCQFQFEVGQDGGIDLWIDYTSTGVEGTQFGAHLEVVDITPAQFVFPAFAYTQDEKDHAGQLASTYTDASLWLGGIGLGFSVTPGLEPGGVVLGVVGLGYGVAARYQQGIHDDPYTDQFPYPYDGAYFDRWSLGLGSCDGAGDFYYWCEDFIQQMVNVAFYGDFAAESANRSNSCVAANAGCQDWQKDRAIYGGHGMGDALANAAGDMWVIGWILDNEGYDDAAGWDLRSFMVYMAELLGDAGNFWQTR